MEYTIIMFNNLNVGRVEKLAHIWSVIIILILVNNYSSILNLSVDGSIELHRNYLYIIRVNETLKYIIKIYNGYIYILTCVQS